MSAINSGAPGKAIAAALREIQDELDKILNADGEGSFIAMPDPAGKDDDLFLQVLSGAAVWDYPKAHA